MLLMTTNQTLQEIHVAVRLDFSRFIGCLLSPTAAGNHAYKAVGNAKALTRGGYLAMTRGPRGLP